jgi:hypothetical protein
VNLLIIGTALLLGGYLAFSPRLARSSAWKATVTPLASIMGSGFLVSAPLLGESVGNLAVFAMVALLVLAYAVGGAIRFNIRHFEPIENAGLGPAQAIALLSRVVLSGAFFISVTYYLQLLAAFLGGPLGLSTIPLQHALTTAVLVGIGVVGMWRGLDMLEGIEKYAVALNLGMIGALLLALALFNAQLLLDGGWRLPAVSSNMDFNDLRVLLGLLIIIQGFETSRYLGDAHPPDVRIRTMRNAQLISSLIYLIFVSLITVRFTADMEADVTAVVHMTAPIALVLPVLISVAAIGSQFSAAVADASGAGGLIEEITGRRVPPRYAYLMIMLVTVALTWETDVNRIIAYASRAFALFYALQCSVAFLVAWQVTSIPRRGVRLVSFAALALVCLAVFTLGLPAE